MGEINVQYSMKIILASNSPRRKELLAGLGFEYEVRTLTGLEESYPDGLSMEEIPQYISRKKAAAYTLGEDELLITADTIVWLDGEVLGKPANEEEARQMLHKLSGKTHQVVTGVTLKTLLNLYSFASVSQVTFAQLSDEEINYYVSHYRPMDKAGAYGIQEWIGYIGVTSIQGSYFNVMGLPVQRLYTEMKKLNII
ncbi:MAG: septum formation protein Maf [Bacteroidaceae bacterium]|nr:septum formation protein Maf [Bacteroidaceae bacterium]